MTRELTDAEKLRLGITDETEPTVIERGWSADQIREAIFSKGMKIAELERATKLSPGSINQSFARRYPKSDKVIARFLDVHESVIWPNRYFVNGVSIHAHYKIEERSDKELARLNAEFSKKRRITVIKNWHDEPEVYYPEEVKAVIDDPLKFLEGSYERGEDGRFIIPVGDGSIAPDVSARADRRVSLPPGFAN